jgi:DNA-binding NtrC family response regulator
MQTQPLAKHESLATVLELEAFLDAASPNMRAVEAVIRELSQSEVPVLLFGEEGTGKRTIARRIHEGSPHRGYEFSIVNCAKVGAERFDGKPGSPLLCKGTVLFDEVANLDFASQSGFLDSLIRLEQDGRRGLPGRLICGSARDLELEVRSGRFREDLYYRISGVCLRLPPLRQRKQDILSLTTFFLTKFAAEFGCATPVLSEDTRQLFYDYAWPGNIRELRDAARAIVVLGDESVAMGGLRAVLMKSDRHRQSERVSLKEAGRAASRETEKELILEALAKTRWNRRRAAQELKISYKSLLYKLKQIGDSGFDAS